MKHIKAIAAVFIAVALTGCVTTPTSFDRSLANVETNYVPRLVLHTNFVTAVQTVMQTNIVGVPTPVYFTNSIGVPTPIYVTNLTSVITYQTNLVPQYTLTPSETAKGVAGIAGTVGNVLVPGTGGLITTGLLGLLSIFLGYRNRKFAGENSVLSQSAGVLAQIIETGREIMSKTPQGQKAADAFTQWMVVHQAETQTISEISKIVKETTSNTEAQKAADQIIALINKA